jgi:hypothetical protein
MATPRRVSAVRPSAVTSLSGRLPVRVLRPDPAPAGWRHAVLARPVPVQRAHHRTAGLVLRTLGESSPGLVAESNASHNAPRQLGGRRAHCGALRPVPAGIQPVPVIGMPQPITPLLISCTASVPGRLGPRSARAHWENPAAKSRPSFSAHRGSVIGVAGLWV